MKVVFILVFMFCVNTSQTSIILQQRVQNKSRSNTPFIIGGRETTIEQFPHQMALITFNTFSCGASIISSRHGLTAGECSFNEYNLF
jgi:secreted trypsin-like serine protease